MTTVQLQSAEEDHVMQSKAPEQLLNGPCGEIVLSNLFAQTHHHCLLYCFIPVP